MKNELNQAAFGQTSLLKFLEFRINDVKLGDEDIMSCEISWDNSVFGVEGSLVIKDNLDMMNIQQLINDATITIYVKDKQDVEFQRIFKIINIDDTKLQGKHKILNFTFIDEIYYVLSNTYISKSYSNTKLSDIFNEYWTHLGLDDKLNRDLKADIQDTEIVHDFIVVPQNMSFLDWFKLELRKEGYSLYQDRFSIYLKKWAELSPSVLEKLDIIEEDKTNTKHKLSQVVPAGDYMFKIHDIESHFNNSLSQNLNAPVSEVQYFDFGTKSIMQHNIKLEDVYDVNKLNNYENKAMEHTFGTKLYTQQHQTPKEMMSNVASTYKSNTDLLVVLSGNLKYNKFFYNYDVHLSGNQGHKIGLNEGDVVMSGTYTCNKVMDRFFGSKLVQRMFLTRIDHTEKR